MEKGWDRFRDFNQRLLITRVTLDMSWKLRHLPSDMISNTTDAGISM